ncbi:hypothetical protein ACFDR9_001236 [Janthinobacterium sp. CG_23.3]|uniref:hypothetical protein n=1 Tax=Janthinobacterium sp. CG_23.3 TaxID=3349634 RepID=UPI0038D35EA8
MLKTNTILAAMVRLEHFTVASLAAAADEKPATVRTVLNRNIDCVVKKKLLSEPRRRGGQVDTYTLSDAGRSKIKAGLQQIFASLTDDWRETTRQQGWVSPLSAVPLPLSTAEEALNAVEQNRDQDQKVRFFLKRVSSNLGLLQRDLSDGSLRMNEDVARRVQHVEERYQRWCTDLDMRADKVTVADFPVAHGRAARSSTPVADQPTVASSVVKRVAGLRHVFEEVSKSLRQLRLNVNREPGEVCLLIGPAMDDENSKSLAAFIHGGFNILLSQKGSVKRIDTAWFGEAGYDVADAADYLLVTVDSGGQKKALDEAIARIHSVAEAGMRVIVLDESSQASRRFERAGIGSWQYLPEAGSADMGGLLKLLARSA